MNHYKWPERFRFVKNGASFTIDGYVWAKGSLRRFSHDPRGMGVSKPVSEAIYGIQRIRPDCDWQRPGRAKGRDLCREDAQESGHYRSKIGHWRRLCPHRHDSKQDAAEAVLYLSGFRQRTFYGRGYVLKDRIAMSDLIFRAQAVMAREIEVIKAQLRRNYVTTLEGDAAFIDDHTIEIKSEDGSQLVRGHHILIACGTRPAHDAGISIDGKRIFDSDQVHSLEELPRELIVVGAGIIGLEYASMFAAIGVKVTLLDQRPILLDFADREIVESLCFQLRQLGTVFRLGEKVVSVGFDEVRDRVFAKLESRKTVHGQGLLYTVGRQANSDRMNIQAAGLKSDGRGKLTTNEHFQTGVAHIYAAGDVIGFPALASTAMEQGRLASCHMFGKPGKIPPNLIPYGIYTIPEISMVGSTEEQLTRDKVPYEAGVARYAELAKGQMLGDEQGLLKLLFDP
ncbi:MAG TPA: FAD-dependent oxidoreductase, partial [Acidobacteriaceae bacterium]|nr:FAD-dependent oxidoreductase [Acidobacteriaceae bacterium]